MCCYGNACETNLKHAIGRILPSRSSRQLLSTISDHPHPKPVSFLPPLILPKCTPFQISSFSFLRVCFCVHLVHPVCPSLPLILLHIPYLSKSPSILSLNLAVGVFPFPPLSFCCSFCSVTSWSVLCSSSSTNLGFVYKNKKRSGICSALSSDGPGTCTLPKDLKLAALYTVKVLTTWSYVLRHGHEWLRNVTMCGLHFKEDAFILPAFFPPLWSFSCKW